MAVENDPQPVARVSWLRRIATTVVALVGVAVMALAVYAWRSFPQLDGELSVKGLKGSVTVTRDEADVTHIRADSARDAWMALGWVHAQERGWQLEFNRRLMHGELSAVLGTATLETDKLMRVLGIARAAERQYAGLPADTQAALTAYADGINAFFADSPQALPPEFHLLRTRPGTWTPADSVGWALMMALDLGGNWGNEFARLSAAQVLDTPSLWQLFPPYPGDPPAARVDLSGLYRSLRLYRQPPADASVSGASNREGTLTSGILDVNVEGKGSNAWAVTGAHSTTGKPWLANDPHLGLSAPAIWYFAHLQAPGLNVIGATLPGLPFVVLGRTDRVAWSFTNTGPDVQDLYIEQINPGNPAQYRLPDADGQPAWADFTTRQERIAVKGRADDEVLTVRETRHGPVISDAQASHAELLDLKRHVLALRWAALDADNRTVLAGQRANTARSVAELVAAFADHHSPMQNLIAADVDGAVAYKAIGRVPLRRDDNDIQGVAPAPGWLPQYDWAGWIAYADTPQDLPAETEARGWLATANQRITPAGYPFFLGADWTVPYRFERIAERLSASPQHDLASMQALQADVRSAAALKLLPVLRAVASTHPLAAAARQQLARFDGEMRADSTGALIFSVWADELTRGLLAPRLGSRRFEQLYGKRNFRQAVEDIVLQGDKAWCGDRGCGEAARAAFDRALDRLRTSQGADVEGWRWGAAHPALSSHRPFGSVAGLSMLFNVAVPSGGDTYTVNVGQYWANDTRAPFASRHAASMRVIYDLADLERSVFIFQTGQSGLVLSPRYRDMADTWAQGGYRPLRQKPAETRHNLRLQP